MLMVRHDAKHSLPFLCARTLAIAVLVSAFAMPASAQQAASSTPYASTLTGNWGGVRDDLAAHGITILPSLTGFYEGPTAGNADHEFDFGGKADAFLIVDGSKLGLWNGFAIQVHGEYNFGKTPGSVGGTTYPNNVGMAFPYQNEAGGDLTSVVFTQRFGPKFSIMAGKMNMFDFYDAGHKFSGGRGIESFWGTAFVGPPSGIVPVAAFGAVATYKMDPLKFTGMVYDPEDALNRTGLEHPFSEGVTFRGSIDLSSNLAGLARTDSLMVAFSSEKGTDFSSLPYLGSFNTPELRRELIQYLILNGLFGQNSQAFPAGTTEKRGRYWVGYSFEQTLWQSPENPSKSWGLFGQASISDGNPNPLHWSALIGVGGTSPFSGRPNDKFGLGVFCYGYSNDLKRHLDPVIKLGNEYGAEAFYNLSVTKWFHLTADLQVIAPAIKSQAAPPIINPTVVSNSTVVFMGLRAQVRF